MNLFLFLQLSTLSFSILMKNWNKKIVRLLCTLFLSLYSFLILFAHCVLIIVYPHTFVALLLSSKRVSYFHFVCILDKEITTTTIKYMTNIYTLCVHVVVFVFLIVDCYYSVTHILCGWEWKWRKSKSQNKNGHNWILKMVWDQMIISINLADSFSFLCSFSLSQ